MNIRAFSSFNVLKVTGASTNEKNNIIPRIAEHR